MLQTTSCFAAPLGRLARVVFLLAFVAAAVAAHGQSYLFNVLYNGFGSNYAGNNPCGAPVVDGSGNIYGMYESTDTGGQGGIYELVNSSGVYSLRYLHIFNDSDGSVNCSYPSPLSMDNSGNLFGTTSQGGVYGNGVVFEVQNQGNGNFTFKVIYYFQGGADGTLPSGALAIDSSGDIFGTTYSGGMINDGIYNNGTLYKLVPSAGSYTRELLHTFSPGSNGVNPEGGVTLANGNIYGTTSRSGGANANAAGTVFFCSASGNGSDFSTAYTFSGGSDGGNPGATVWVDSNKNIYGTTTVGGANGYGTVYELSVVLIFYSEKTLYSFTSQDGSSSEPLLRDASGNFYGTTAPTWNNGEIFELVNSSGNYSERVLHSFSAGADGSEPYSGLVADMYGNLYGTSSYGPTAGAVWELAVPSNTSTQITSSLNPANLGDSVTFTATTTVSPSDTPLDGSITFYEGSTKLATEPVSNGTASLTVSDATTLGAGTYPITASFTSTYAGQSNSSGTVQQTINAEMGIAITSGSNTFNGTQTVNGTVNATNFAGNGSGLTNVTAAGLACAGCVGNYQLGVNYAASPSQGGPASNSLELGGWPVSNFATTGSNSFTGDQSISGGLTTTGNLGGAAGNFSGKVSSSGLALATAGTATAGHGYNSSPLDTPASLFNSSTSAAQSMLFRWQAEPVAATNDTASPAATLNLLYGANGTPSETGLSVNANGTFNFAAGQTFPGTTDGTITGVTAGAGLTGGGTAGNVTLGLASNSCAPGSAVTGIPFVCSPFVTSGSNVSFGTVTAASFTGNGSGVTGVNAATAVTAANLTGNISEAQVSNLPADLANASTFAANAASTAQANAETFATNAANTAEANAVSAAETFGNTTFLPLAGGTLTGALNSPGVAVAPSGAATSAQGYNSGGLDTTASLFNSNSGMAQNVLFRWQAEPVALSNNTGNPAATLNLLYAGNGTPAETGISVNANGTLTAPAFSGDGSQLANVSAVNATILTGSITEGQVTNLTADLANASSSAISAAEAFTTTTVANAQTADQNFATSAANTAQTNAQNFATTAANNAQSTSETFASNAANAAQANAIAVADAYSNGTFVPLAGGTMSGALNLPSLAATGAVTSASVTTGPVTATSAATGSLTIGGGTAIIQYVSVTQTITLPAINTNQCATLQSSPIAGFTPGSIDTLALGIPGSLMSVPSGPTPPAPPNGPAPPLPPPILFNYQAWETSTAASPTVTIEICNMGGPGYHGGATGTIRIDIFKH